MLDRPGALDTYGLCGTAAPGTPGFERVVCARPHSVARGRHGPDPAAERYPGVARARTAGDDVCEDRARARRATR